MAITDNTQKIRNLLDAINSLPEAGGTELPELTNPGTGADLAAGTQLIGADGEIVDGELESYATSLEAECSGDYVVWDDTNERLKYLVNFNDKGIVPAGTALTLYASKTTLDSVLPSTDSDPVVQPLTVTPTKNTQTFNPSGFDGYAPVTVNPIPSSYVQPGGTKTITENGTYDVASFAQALVNVASGGGGELPSGIIGIDSGTVTPTEKVTSYLSVSHSLGVVPNFCIWWEDGDYSASVGSSHAILGVSSNKKAKYTSTSAIIYSLHYAICGYINSQYGNTSAVLANSSYFKENAVWLKCSSNYPLLAGRTYRWVVCALEDFN